MRIFPYRTYAQMLEDGDLPPVGSPKRYDAIMRESFMRGVCEGVIVVASGLSLAFVLAVYYWP